MASQSDNLWGEPTLDDLFEEPIVQLIMKRDGIHQHDMRAEISRLLKSYAVSGAGETALLS